jgi:steroid 5-alpha reductase family enzyme
MTLLIISTLVLCFFVMSLTWFLARLWDNAGIVDVTWSLLFAGVALLYFVSVPGFNHVQGMLFAMVTIWSLRLGIYLWIRVYRHHPQEDPRYHALRPAFPGRVWLMFFVFFQIQGLLIVLLSVPFALVWVSGPSQPGLWEWLGFALWLVAVLGESAADRQLQTFKSDPRNHGKTCRVGLWRYSRHPNYFFEWLVWMAFFIFALGTPWGWTAFYAPLLMLWFLWKFTGIPASEARALLTRGDDYRAYQQATSAFFPWFPKKEPLSR